LTEVSWGILYVRSVLFELYVVIKDCSLKLPLTDIRSGT